MKTFDLNNVGKPVGVTDGLAFRFGLTTKGVVSELRKLADAIENADTYVPAERIGDALLPKAFIQKMESTTTALLDEFIYTRITIEIAEKTPAEES